MPSGTSKEERKRKRASEVQESSVSASTKKLKRERPVNGASPENVSRPGNGVAMIPTASAMCDDSAAAQTEAQIQEKSRDGVQKKEKSQKKRKARKTRDQRVDKEASRASPTDEAATEQPSLIGRELVAKENEPAEYSKDKTATKQHKFDRKRQKYIDKFHILEAATQEGRDVSKDLHLLLKAVDAFINRHGLLPDDQLVKLHADHKEDTASMWKMSRPTGGRFIDHEPVITVDEKHIILATSGAIHVYDTETSLLVRTIGSHSISCYALSPSRPQHLYVGTHHGHISILHWTMAKWIASTKAGTGESIRSLRSVCSSGQEDVLFTVENASKSSLNDEDEIKGKHENQSSCVVVRRVSEKGFDQSSHTIFQAHGHLRHLRVLDGGRAIVVAGDNELVVATGDKTIPMNETSLDDLKHRYRWRSVHASQTITCVDAHSRTVAFATKDGRKHKEQSYSIAIGSLKGEVLIYDDVVSQLDKAESADNAKPPLPRVLRWHREAPNVVRWSKDGNYVLSGGKETVLCLWQLETGHRQDLPHLTAAIRDLSVSPSGTSYALHLADNSIMVLSTAELVPRTYITGPQSLCVDQHLPWKSLRELYKPTPLINHPHDPNLLLMAAPVEQQVRNKTLTSPPSPFLQTFNLQASRHIARQPLTRNLVTESNVDPDWNKLEVPDITLMQISYDGKWLATVEEWLPPARDVQHLATDQVELVAEQQKRRETYLKFWRWDESGKKWALNTRIAQPHADYRDERANRTFQLAAHPSRARFVTIGEDSRLRIWSLRRQNDQVAWFAKSVVKLGSNSILAEGTFEFTVASSPTIGRMAYSNDGSILAVCLQDNSSSTSNIVQFLDADSGMVRAIETGLVAGDLVAMGFLDRYLILVSDELRVWDIVIGSMVFNRSLSHTDMRYSQRRAITHLAISEQSKSFALAGIGIANEQKGSSVLVFKPADANPIFQYHLRVGAVAALSSLVEGTGFVMLDSQAELRTLTTHIVPVTGPRAKSATQGIEGQVAAIQLNVEQGENDETSGDVRKAAGTRAIEDGTQQIKSEQWAKIFSPTGSGGFGTSNSKNIFDGIAASLLPVKAR